MKGSITRRGNNSWRIRFDMGRDPVTGKRTVSTKTVRGTKKQAEAALTRDLAAVESGTWVEPSSLTVDAYFTKWLGHVQTRVSRRTHERYAELAHKQLLPRLGLHPLRKLSPLHIEHCYSEMLANGRLRGTGGLSARTVCHAHRVLFAALKQAVRWRLVAHNACEAVSPPRADKPEIAVLDDTEVGTLLRAAKGSRLYVPILIAVTCGLRRGEVLALRWTDVDFERGSVTVAQAVEETRSGGVAIKAPKTKSSRRTLTMPSITVEALRRHKAEQAAERLALGLGRDERQLCFTTVEGGLLSPNSVSSAFAHIAAGAGVRVTFHGLRHVHITSLLKAGVHPKLASARAGHSSISITMDTYSHVSAPMESALVDGVDAAIRAALERRPGPVS